MKKWLNSENAVTFAMMFAATVLAIIFTPTILGWKAKAANKSATSSAA